MQDYKIEILGLSEVRWRGCGEQKTANGNTILFSGKEDRCESGVGILMSKEVRKSLIEWAPVSDRIITARIRTRTRNANIVQCYAPTEVDLEGPKDDFYDLLATTIDKIHKGEIIILMGDFNAKVGNSNTGCRRVLGQHGTGTRTDNGDRLIELCQHYDLVVGGSIFPHKEVHKYTWESPNGAKNQIDHICINNKWRHVLQDVRTRRGADLYTDHIMIVATIQLKIMAVRRNVTLLQRTNINTDRLKRPEIREAFSHKLNDLIVDNTWQEAHLTAAMEVLGEKDKRPGRPWISEDTWRLIGERKALKALLNRAENATHRHQYNLKEKEVKKSARKDRRTYISLFAKEAEDAASKYDMRTLYRKTKAMAKGSTNSNQPIRDKRGNVLSTVDQQLNRWREHYEELLNYDRPNEQPNQVPVDANNDERRIGSNPPTEREIIAALKKLKSNKAAGADGIPAELLKAAPIISARALKPYIGKAWMEERFDEDCKEGIIVKIPKRGDLTNCNNWRGITLLNAINKIVAQIILSRITPHIESTLREEQAGFRANRGCIDQSNTLRLIIEQSMEYQTPLYLVFVDFEKAFDRVDRNAIWNTLNRRGIPPKITRLISALYDGAKTSVLHRGMLSTEFTINSGVRQGCVLSPLLFITVLDEAMVEAMRLQKGLWWTLTSKLDDLDFADDICLLANSHSDMQSKLQSLSDVAERSGLRINLAKTKLMRINAANQEPIRLNNIAIEEVQNFSYLGSVMATDGGTTEDIQNRMMKARAAYGGLNKIWRCGILSTNTKLQIFRACVMSVLLYGSETWKYSERVFGRAQAFLNKCLRRLLGVFWPNRITNQDLYNKARIKPLTQIIKERKWRWIGHTLRKPQDSISRRALDWNPQGNRRRGRPKTTWRRTVLNELAKAGISWPEVKALANNRVRWKTFSEALCSN